MTAEVLIAGDAQPQSATRFIAPASVALIGVAAFGYVAVRNPFENQLSPVCGFYHLTGLYCPGCGATRSAYMLMQGDVAYALQLNALFVVVLLPLGLLGFAWWIARLAGAKVPGFDPPVWLTWSFVAFIVAFAVIRNLPIFAPYLTPYGGP